MKTTNEYGQNIWYKPLARKVLIVAVEGVVSDYAVYIDAVKGENHDKECFEVAEMGVKLPKEIAEYYFPECKHLTYRE